MKVPEAILLDIEIDKLTNSIEQVATGEVLQTLVLATMANDLKTTTKKNGWRFDWRKEARQPRRNVFKLEAVDNPSIVQGLVSLEIEVDHVYLHLVESAPINQGKAKEYVGVPGNLFAYACKLAFEQGREGNVAFTAKTQLIAHYMETLGAWHIGGHRMLLDTVAARRLVNRYVKDSQP
ncbi:MAG: hypothetical protein EOO60_12625 [Hymenobacter sp.]|nr:MAG: hypothetical protein EOO60_12625 [Hymenobacter sp.]